MNILTQDFIAIDTNVFEHLFNPEKNTNDHIWNLIDRLHEDKIGLLIDSPDDPRKGSRIMGEYDRRLLPYVKPRQEVGAESVLLKIFFENAKLVEVDVNQTDKLMVLIKGIIGVREGESVTDRFFVYVAFKKDRVLVTNDRGDIWNNREELKRKARKAKKRRLEGADILNSQEAYERIADGSSAGGEPNHE